MANSKQIIEIESKKRKLLLIFYIIMAFVFMVLIIDITLYLVIGKVRYSDNTPSLNIQGTSQDLQNELKNILNQ